VSAATERLALTRRFRPEGPAGRKMRGPLKIVIKRTIIANAKWKSGGIAEGLKMREMRSRREDQSKSDERILCKDIMEHFILRFNIMRQLKGPQSVERASTMHSSPSIHHRGKLTSCKMFITQAYSALVLLPPWLFRCRKNRTHVYSEVTGDVSRSISIKPQRYRSSISRKRCDVCYFCTSEEFSS